MVNNKVNNKNGLPPADGWAGPNGKFGAYIAEQSTKTLDAYRYQPYLVDEHANSEEDTARGGYAHRQLFELVQNSADALAGVPAGGRIEIRLTEAYLYCADDGEPIDCKGVTALMFSHMSPKRGTREIGRFGLGFKSVLGVTDAPEFFSRSGSFRFDRTRSKERIGQFVPDAERYPALRLPDPIDPSEYRAKDDTLSKLMEWATNIVRLPLKPEAVDDLGQQMRSFPPEFLLFVKHVRQLTLNGGQSEVDRTLELADVDGEYLLGDGDAICEWKLFNDTHRLSDNAQADRRSIDDGGEVDISWAVPLDRLTDPGKFWAFFPMKTVSLVAGILNAPWKTNEDRQNLLPGPYNDELIESAAKMVADNLPDLSTQTDPARHLDALPRRHERGDTEQADRLRKDLFSNLHGCEIIPDQDGNLRAAHEVSYPPKKLTPDGKDMALFNRWAAYAGRPSDWLHHRALTRNRIAAVDRLWPDQLSPAAPRAAVAEWLEALVTDQEPENITEASMAAIQTAAHISPEIRFAIRLNKRSLGDIVLMANGELKAPDPERIFLPDGGHGSGPDSSVHPELASDGGTLEALKKLGIKPPSPENTFKRTAEEVLNSPAEPNATLWTQFWEQARKVESAAARYIIQGIKNYHRAIWPEKLLVRTQSGGWRPLHSVLLPGGIVPGDGSRDDHAAVDMSFHQPDDLELLNNLGVGVTDAPRDDRDLSLEPQFSSFLHSCRQTFRDLPDLPHIPEWNWLNFISTEGVGPTEVLTVLSDEGRVLYTDALLSHDAIYEQWTMRHDTVHYYPEKHFESLTIHMLRKYGRVRTSDGIVVPFKDALGPQPENPAALRALLAHPKADRIKEVFNLSEPTPEFIGEEDSVPLTDVWPGLDKHLPARRKTCQLIRCERILSGIGESECVFHDGDVYLARTGDDDEDHELWLVSRELELDLNERQLEAVLQYETLREIEERRTAVREHTTDAERLLEAVGEQVLRCGLPSSLLAILEFETKGAALTDLQIAEAAIATYHSDALKQYKLELGHLGPPKKWAGSAPAVAFVRSLGFSDEWAGEQNRRRDPFVEIEGPYSLPELHDYQRTVVGKVRDMLRDGRAGGAERRGMISMPTGSGKTRIAVQAIVEAMCHDSFKGGVLWVADRDELCEQAVEAWQQVWSRIGAHGSRLRVSRMWARQPPPLPTSDLHVVVATIQTLNAKLRNQPSKYEFLTDFKLVVFDEAHRSIAPTFTSAMQEIGLTRRQEADEPFLLGLTATPYRGYNEEETDWLVNRYSRSRLDAGAFESDDPQRVIRELQSMRVLALADHKTIEGGVFSLDIQEREQMASVPWLPRSVEERIAEDSVRTRRIIEAYETHVDPNWPTLIFATSVKHAQTVAALLNARGIKSRAVSGDTETSTRRRVVEEFRRGEIKALVNYAVFREGFDAPKTRAIIVARPVYSPNLYFQMIGRGLRGVKNGGNDRCLILNVEDNIENFQQALAFSELDWLWA